MVAWGHGGLRCAHAGGPACGALVLVSVAVVLCAVDGARAAGGGPAPAVRSLQGALRSVEQDFEDVGLVCWR